LPRLPKEEVFTAKLFSLVWIAFGVIVLMANLYYLLSQKDEKRSRMRNIQH
jgi:hypothetical protein